MALRIKPTADIGQKFIKVTPGRVDEYVIGTSDPTVKWQEPTAQAAGNYSEGVQQAIANKAFEKGVARAGDEDWRAGVSGKGKDRFGPGVRGALDRYTKGFDAFRNAIERTTLPVKGIKGSAQNSERSAAMQRVLHETKLRM